MVDKKNPQNLILTIHDAKIDSDLVEQPFTLHNDLVKQITFYRQSHRTVQAVIELKLPASGVKWDTKWQPSPIPGSSEWILAIDLMRNNNAWADDFKAVQGKVIVVDPGHGGSDSGAIGPDGIMEKNVTLAVSQKLATLLRANGAKVVMTRNTDRDVYAPNCTAREELQARVDVAENTPHASTFICIHANSFIHPSAHGTETFYYYKSSRSHLLATDIQKALVQANHLSNRGVSTANFYVLKHNSIPSVLIELAFISNPKEEKLLNTPSFQNVLAHGICSGINKYYQSN